VTLTIEAIFFKIRNLLLEGSGQLIFLGLSAVKQADRVLVFEDGRVIEEGRHEELLENNGLYFSLYGRQELNLPNRP
jgi:ATP-binding cassette, subfamily C, bacterial